MPVTAPNTNLVMLAMQAAASNIIISPINGISSYNTVSIGAKKDVTNLLPLLEITALDDLTERVSMNQSGQYTLIDDEQTFELTTTVDYSDSLIGEEVIIALRDALTQVFHSASQLNNTTGVVGTWLQKSGRYGYAMRNGVWCRMHKIQLRVGYYYDTLMGA